MVPPILMISLMPKTSTLGLSRGDAKVDRANGVDEEGKGRSQVKDTGRIARTRDDTGRDDTVRDDLARNDLRRLDPGKGLRAKPERGTLWQGTIREGMIWEGMIEKEGSRKK